MIIDVVVVVVVVCSFLRVYVLYLYFSHFATVDVLGF